MNYLKKTALLMALNVGLTAASRLAAEPLTLTDTQGRALTAEVLSVEKTKVTIKRADGQVFSLPLDNLIAADQTKLAALAEKLATAEAAKPLAADAIKIELNRGNFKTTKKTEDVITTIQENWGYALTISNHTPKPVEGLRAEYRLFATVDNPGVTQDKLILKKKAYKTSIEPLGALEKITFRTETITAIKTELPPGYVYSNSGRTESGERLYGIWLRIFRGDQLVKEIAMPESLRTKEKW